MRTIPSMREKPLFPSPIHQHAPSCSSTASAPTRPICSPAAPAVATKIIIPFDPFRSARRRPLVVRRPARLCRSLARRRAITTARALERDLTVLRLLNAMPSLDPFLLREHLRNNKIDVAPCYFAISEGDQERMHDFRQPGIVAADHAGRRAAHRRLDQRMVTAMLSNQVDEKLEPLRLTLGPDRRRFPRRRVQLARLSLLQMVDGQILARRDGRSARDQRHPAPRRRQTPNRTPILPPPAATSSRWCATMAIM